MSIELFANNAQTTLASNASNTQTSIQVAPGTGALFPSPGAGQYFRITLTSVGSGYREICFCTGVAGDVLTIVRGEEGTSANNFLTGDTVGNYDTAGAMGHLVQSEQLQGGTYQGGSAGGTANALTVTIPSNLTALPDRFGIVLEATQANTAPVTLNVTLGSTVIGAYPVVKGTSIALVAGDIVGDGYPLVLNWSATLASWVLQNPGNGINLIAAVPTGTLATFPSTTPPSGYLICAGQLLSRTTYAALYAFAVASGNISANDGAWTPGQFSPGDGFTNFRIPQLGGYFLRGLDNGNGIDPSRVIGTVQGDANLAHTHTATSTVTDPEHNHGGGGGSPTTSVTDNGTDIIQVSSPGGTNAAAATGITVGTTVANSGGSESRPINIAYPVCIKY